MASKTITLEMAAKVVLPELVTLTEIAERAGYPRVTVEKWRQRSKKYAAMGGDDARYAFPEPRLTVANGKTGLWLWSLDIVPWLEFTERGEFMAKAGE